MVPPFTAISLLAVLLLAACATTPPMLLEAHASVRNAALEPGVQANAPLELRRASDSLARADSLLANGASTAEVSSAAYLANQQARTALALAQARGNEKAIGAARQAAQIHQGELAVADNDLPVRRRR